MLTRLASLLLLSTSLLACTGDDGAATGDDDGSAAHCTEASSMMSMPIDQIANPSGGTQVAQWQLLAPMSASSVLAYAPDAAGAQRIAVLDANGAQDVASIAGGANYYLRAAKVGDCALLSAKNGLGLACPGQPYEVAGQDFDTSGSDPLFAVQSGSDIIAFTQSYAAFTQITRSGPGQWSQQEQYESSISFPTDALLANGAPVACFIDEADHAVVAYGAGRVRSTAKAQWCKLAVSGDMLTVVTNIGTVTQPLSSFAADGVLALAGAVPAMDGAPVRLVTLDGGAAAIEKKSSAIAVTPLDGSAGKLIPTLGNSTLDVTGNALTVVSTTTDSTSTQSGTQYSQTVLFETHCL